MEKEYVPYSLALRMKDLGFNEYCMGACYYEWVNRGETHIMLRTPDDADSKDGVKAPLFQQAFRWFRDEYGLNSCVDGLSGRYYFNIRSYKNLACSQDNESVYEKAELACLTKLIEIAEQKQK